MLKGNLVDWDDSIWDLENMMAADESTESVCKPPRPGHIILPEQRNFSSHASMCSKFRGVASVVRDQGTMQKMDLEISKYQDCGFVSMNGRLVGGMC